MTETLERKTPTAVGSSDLVRCGPWKCFHCQEIFHDEKSAEEHFGRSVVCAPICQIYGTTVRNMENELSRYRNEDTDLHRQIMHLQTEHQTALMRAEESGYAKGLSDARQCVRDSERINWLEKCLESHIIGRDSIEGDWFITLPHVAIVTAKEKTLRDAIDAAIEKAPNVKSSHSRD